MGTTGKFSQRVAHGWGEKHRLGQQGSTAMGEEAAVGGRSTWLMTRALGNTGVNTVIVWLDASNCFV